MVGGTKIVNNDESSGFIADLLLHIADLLLHIADLVILKIILDNL